VTPADITASADFRVGLARRLAEVGLIPPQAAGLKLAALPIPPATPDGEDRKAA
jgi:hypothetical protein